MSEVEQEVAEEITTEPNAELEGAIDVATALSRIPRSEQLDFLQAHEYNELGNGHFSTVYGKDASPYVIKVCRRDRDSWPFFAKYCIDNKDNPDVNFILPTVHKFIKSRERGLYVAVLDKLYTFKGSYNSICHDYLTEEQSDRVRCVFRAFHAGCDYYGNRRHEHSIASQYKYFCAAEMIMKDLEQFCSLDLHGGNVMQDAEGNLVVTDPVSFSNSAEQSSATLDSLDPAPYAPIPEPEEDARRRSAIIMCEDLMPLEGFDFAAAEARVAAHLAVQNIPKPKQKGQQSTFIRGKIHGHHKF